jgi:hypothetical protein
MLRRHSKSSTALDQTKQDLARQESEVRDQMQKLERMIEEAPRMAEEISRQQREELLERAGAECGRLDVSVGLYDKRYGDDDRAKPRRRALRKERREGRIIFVVLMIALLIAIIWLVTYLRSF